MFTHCSCHRLNLAVVASCGEQRIRNLMANINEISYFFNFPVPQNNFLQEEILQFCPYSSKHKLKDVCRIGWVEQIEGMDVFQDLFVPVYRSLLIMKENNNTVHYNNETSTKAESLFKVIDDFEFIIILVISRSILDYLLPATWKLQSKDLDVAKSADIISSLKSSIQNFRTSVDEYHSKWYNDSLNLQKKLTLKNQILKNLELAQDRHIDQFSQLKPLKIISKWF